MPLMETLRQAWADEELRRKLLFVMGMFAVFALGINVPVPIPGISSAELTERVKQLNLPFFQLLDVFGGGGLRRLSIFALGMNPYITASIIMQILTQAYPSWKQELKEGGEYARRQQNKRTRMLTIVLCVFQSLGLIGLLNQALPPEAQTMFIKFTVVLFWTSGAMFVLWLGEQISEKGIGNGVSLMIFAGIILSLPNQVRQVWGAYQEGFAQWWQLGLLLLLFLGTTWLIVLFTISQRRIPIQHMRRVVGTKMMGGQTSYLPLSVVMAGVIPLIFAVSLIYIPQQFASMFAPTSPIHLTLIEIGSWLNPASPFPKGLVASVVYTALIFFFTYFYTAIQFNVDDISDNLKRGGSFIPGVRPGKQTRDFLDGVISRITIAGAGFLAFVALIQYVAWSLTGIQAISIIGGTSLLIMVSVALETMRQIEASLLMKHYGQ
ncbi:MAG: preprotein translocase subunit SecY [Fimbriimonadaceae bacterium]|nr:preprotein translocase subunit SecY [Chthonomonadaceae bacterium]MCO5295707.1 preprotein translocase subunit SecY [Fimbriimonadaceae bacterium]